MKHTEKLLALFLAGGLLLAACSSPKAPTPAAKAPTSHPPTSTVVAPTAPAPTEQPPAPTATIKVVPTSEPASTLASPETDIPENAGSLARQHLVELSEEIGPRLPGSAAEREAASYIQQTFEEAGYTVETQPFSFTNEESNEDGSSANVIAIKPGASPHQIIVGAHYDSVDDAEGVDDNASGVAVLLETAALVQEEQTPYTIVFIAFGAEENNLDGSTYYVSQMSKAEIADVVAMINLDSLAAGDHAYVYGDPASDSLMNWFVQAAVKDSFPLEGVPEADLDANGVPCDCADYDAFQEQGIPFAYFEATNWELGDQDGMTQVGLEFGEDGAIRHTEYDTIQYIDETFPGRIDSYMQMFVTLLYQALTQFE